ncbi:MAG: hypothetical protein GXX04_11795, partial [Clostridiaceae bacterium]|nr:hypothetical protein [Clostridiaceae bacterium]
MKNKLIVVLFIIILILLTTNSSLAFFPPHSKNNEYDLNITLSMQHKTAIYDSPFGDFLVDKSGTMVNKKGEPGEYKYLGFNYYNQPITNDRYFRRIERRGNVFDENYTNVEWQEIPEALESWDKIIKDDAILNYILTTNFYDEDHPTKGETDTGFNLLKLFRIPEGSTDYTEIYKRALVLTQPNEGCKIIIKLEYDGTNWNTVEIPAIPSIECIMTAEADKYAIETGKTESVTIKIDTSHSYWVMADKERKDFSKRRYWAG